MLSVLLTLALATQAIGAQVQRNDTRSWYQAYADAQSNIQKQNWQGALNDLDIAAQRGAPRPGKNVLFYGDVYRDYNPDYYRGVAFLNLRRYEEATQAFDRVRQAQLIANRDPLYAEFTRQSTMARDTLQQQVAQNAQNAPVAQVPPPNVAQTAPPTGLGAQAPTIVAGIVPPPGGGAPLNGTTQSAGGGLAVPAQTSPPPAASATRAPVTRPPVPTKAPVQARVTPAAAIPPSNAAVAPSAPLDERAGVLQFYSGNYDGAATALQTVTYAPGASPRAFFYLACARAALVLTGKAPRSAMDDARAQLARASDDGQFAADKRLISPRIRQELGMAP